VASVDDGYSTAGDFSLTNDRYRLHGAASREAGTDREFGDGTIRPSEYSRNAFDVGYAMRIRGDVASIDYRRNDTSDAGTPALPMDDIFSDADLVRGTYNAARGDLALDFELYWNDIEHQMNNSDLRSAQPGSLQSNVTVMPCTSNGSTRTWVVGIWSWACAGLTSRWTPARLMPRWRG
jgi:iron complex outermembrane recepter protein